MGRPGVFDFPGQPIWREHSDHHAGRGASARRSRAGLEGTGHHPVWRPAIGPLTFIERALKDLRAITHRGGDPSSSVILYVFLRDARASLIAFMAIPPLPARGDPRSGAPGTDIEHHDPGRLRGSRSECLVDDAIIGIENILRRLRGEPGAAATARPPANPAGGLARSSRAPSSMQPRSSSPSLSRSS